MNVSRRSVLAGALGTAATAAATGLAAPAASAAAPETLRVLAFNIWMGGSVVPDGLRRVADIIRDLDIDVVLLSESGDSTAELAAMLSTGRERWSYADSGDTGVLSRHPVIETARLDWVTKAVLRVGSREVAAYAVHLEYRWYATYLPRGYGGGSASGPFARYGWDKIPTGPVTDVAAIEADNHASGRPAVIDAVLADAAKEQARRRSVIIGGDFNEPSALDWTAATKNLYDHNGVVIRWESTAKLLDAGYTDAYRAVFPDPVTHPGMTWPADNPQVGIDQLAWAPEADERDRIDYVFASPSPGLKLLQAGIVGPRGSIVRSRRVLEPHTDDILASPTPWPSDHKAVLAVYRFAGPKPRG